MCLQIYKNYHNNIVWKVHNLKQAQNVKCRFEVKEISKSRWKNKNKIRKDVMCLYQNSKNNTITV